MKNVVIFLLALTMLVATAYGYSCNVKNCNLCAPTNASICQACNDRYYVNQTTSGCDQCTKNCLKCTSPTDCETCAGGYTFNSQTHACEETPGLEFLEIFFN